MAMKKRAVTPKKTANDDTVIYKVMVALGMLCVLLLSVQLVSRRYVMIDYMFTMMTALFWLAIGFAVTAAVLLALWLICRAASKFWRAAGFPLFLMALLLALTCAVLYATWVEYVSALYAVYIAAAVLYMIALLYQHEFFLLSLLNTCAGVVFFQLYRIREDGVLAWARHEVYGPAISRRALLLIVGLVVIILAASSLMFLARRKGGKVKVFGKARQLFSPDASALLVYISGALWVLCLLAAVLLGATFSYYCIFAVAAVELIAAVYYTVKLA